MAISATYRSIRPAPSERSCAAQLIGLRVLRVNALRSFAPPGRATHSSPHRFVSTRTLVFRQDGYALRIVMVYAEPEASEKTENISLEILFVSKCLFAVSIRVGFQLCCHEYPSLESPRASAVRRKSLLTGVFSRFRRDRRQCRVASL